MKGKEFHLRHLYPRNYPSKMKAKFRFPQKNKAKLKNSSIASLSQKKY
jgi:hypothetical protein